MDCSPLDSSVHGILQTRILQWVAVPFSRESSRPRDRTCISHIAGRFFTIWATKEAPFYTWQCIYVNATLSIHPTLLFLHIHVHVSVLYICVSFLSRQIDSSVLFFLDSTYHILMHICQNRLFKKLKQYLPPGSRAYQAPLSVGFSRQEYWSGLPFPSPGDLPNPGIEPRYPALQADALPSEPPGKPITIDHRWAQILIWLLLRFTLSSLL